MVAAAGWVAGRGCRHGCLVASGPSPTSPAPVVYNLILPSPKLQAIIYLWRTERHLHVRGRVRRAGVVVVSYHPSGCRRIFTLCMRQSNKSAISLESASHSINLVPEGLGCGARSWLSSPLWGSHWAASLSHHQNLSAPEMLICAYHGHARPGSSIALEAGDCEAELLSGLWPMGVRLEPLAAKAVTRAFTSATSRFRAVVSWSCVPSVAILRKITCVLTSTTFNYRYESS